MCSACTFLDCGPTPRTCPRTSSRGSSLQNGASVCGNHSLFSVREFHYPVQDPHGDWLATHRTSSTQLLGLFRFETDSAFSMAVQVILALLREEIYGPDER